MSSAAPIPIIKSVSRELAPATAWLCDIWGVIHNGVGAFPEAVDACVQFRANGGRVILVSNAPRPSDRIVPQLDALRVPRKAYDAILTSGDVARAEIETWHKTPVLHIGPQRDLPLLEGLAIERTDATRAERVVCSGLYKDETETPETYRDVLATLAARAVPMLAANPDIQVERGGKLIYCGGAVAALYETMGGSVLYAGKPYPAIYATAFRMVSELCGRDVPLSEILAIGDGVNTDIRGGTANGLRTLYTASAIHLDGPLTSAALAQLFPDPAIRPTAAMTRLTW